jgi:hypothetical protein
MRVKSAEGYDEENAEVFLALLEHERPIGCLLDADFRGVCRYAPAGPDFVPRFIAAVHYRLKYRCDSVES